MAGKVSNDEKQIPLLDEDEQAGSGQIWVACVCLALSLLCSALWLFLLLRPA